MRRDDARLVRHTEFAQDRRGVAHRVPVRRAAHDHADERQWRLSHTDILDPHRHAAFGVHGNAKAAATAKKRRVGEPLSVRPARYAGLPKRSARRVSAVFAAFAFPDANRSVAVWPE